MMNYIMEKTGVSVPSGSKRTPLRIPYADIRDLDITMLDNREIVLIISASRLGETVLYARGFAPYKKKSFGWESFLSFFAALQMRTGKHTPLKQQGIQEHRKKILSFPVLRFSYNVRIRHIALLAAMAAGCILYLSVRFINSPPKNPDLIFLLWRIPGRWVPDYDMALFLLLIVILIVTMGIGITTGLSAKNRIELSKTALVVPSARFKRKKEASYNEIRSVSVDCLRIPGYGRHPTARTVTVLWPGGKLTMNSSWFSNTDEFEIFVCVLNYRQALAAVFPPYRYN